MSAPYETIRVKNLTARAPVSADVFPFDGSGGVGIISLTNLVAQLSNAVGLIPGSDDWLKFMGANLLMKSWANITYTSGVYTGATVVWPDGSAGVFTGTVNATWLELASFTVTHVNSGKTVTQPTITFDSNGNITTYPATTVA